MPIRVLAFESDTQFAGELESEFRSLGCEITVVDDVNGGLQAASANRPDLILLTIELPRMSGYSVCNRIKRDADLKDIPLIIMSSESTDQTFEQHRRLGTRAQDYIRKPVTFSALIERVRPFIDLKSVSLSPDDDGIVIDDEIELTEEARISQVPASRRPASLRPIDADIEDFAELAFGAMIEKSPATEPPRASVPALPSVHPSSPRVPTDVSVESSPHIVSLDQERTDAELARLKSQLEEKERLLSEALGEVRELKRASRVAQSDASEAEDLKRELRDLKMKLSTPSMAPKQSMGPTAREFLDLREQLNKKDKELLDVRDQITRRDKELLNLRDTTLAHERDKADLSDKLDEVTRQLADLQKIADAARNDKEAAAKRADDFKRKSEKFAGLLEEKTSEVDRMATQHTAALEAARANAETHERQALETVREAAIEQRNAALETARAESERALAEAIEQALEAARANAETHERQALEAARETAIEQQNVALSELERRLRSEHAADKSQALSEMERTLRTEHSTDKAQALGQLQNEKDHSERELESRLHVLQKELESASAELARSRQETQQRDERIASQEASLNALRRELEQANSLVSMREESVATLQRELSIQKGETSEALDQLSAERHRLKVAVDKSNEDHGSLERVKDALAAALIQVEAIEARTLE
jgi:DNA-binding response OmpR family regulator/chromosome segregation ATPase